MVFIKKEGAQRDLFPGGNGLEVIAPVSSLTLEKVAMFKPSLTGDLGHRMGQRLHLSWKPLRLSLSSNLIGFHIPRYNIERGSMSVGFCLWFHDQECPGYYCYEKWTGRTPKLLIRQFQGLKATKTGIWIVIMQNREWWREDGSKERTGWPKQGAGCCLWDIQLLLYCNELSSMLALHPVKVKSAFQALFGSLLWNTTQCQR